MTTDESDGTEFAPGEDVTDDVRTFLRHDVAAVVHTTLEGEILEANPSAARLVRVDGPSTLQGENISDFYRDPEDRQALIRALKSEGVVENLELSFRRPDGSEGWVLLNARLTYERSGSEPTIWATMVDVTERKRMEKARRHLAALVDHSEDAIIAKSLDGRIESWNTAAERMYGWTAEEAIGEPATMLVPSDEQPKYERLLEQAARGELVQGREVERVRKDGSRFQISLTLSPIRDEDGELIGISGIDRDITELRRYRERLETLVRERTRELEEREEALRRAERMEAIGRLTGGVAHDFNNLLHVIGGNLEILRRIVDDDEKTRQRLQSAADAVERGAELTSQLLTFARRKPLEPAVVNPEKLLREMNGLIRRTIDESVEIEMDFEEGVGNAVCDPHRLESVILNLIVNARDAMEGAGRLSIRLENSRLGEEQMGRGTEVTPGPYVCLSVSDTGRGISDEDLEHVYEPFFTTKSNDEGTGLGLSMAYGFVKQSGGYIDIESEVGEGTTVRLYLPYTEESEESTDESADSYGGELCDETILVVEDDDGVRATVVEMLDDLGYDVLEASDGASALALLQDCARVDLLFTDVVMPGPVRSTELAERARALVPDLKVLFTSGYSGDAIAGEGRLGSDVELLDKPYDQEELARRIRETL